MVQIDHFVTVTSEEDQPFMKGKRRMANFVSGMSYRVTAQNAEFFKGLLEAGKAVVGQVRPESRPGVGIATGAVSVREEQTISSKDVGKLTP